MREQFRDLEGRAVKNVIVRLLVAGLGLYSLQPCPIKSCRGATVNKRQFHAAIIFLMFAN